MPVVPGDPALGEVPDALPGGPDTSTSQAGDVPGQTPGAKASEPAPAASEPAPAASLPSLGMSLLPVLLPVALIALHTTFGTLQTRAAERVEELRQPAADAPAADAPAAGLAAAEASLADYETVTSYTAVLGNPNFALLLSTAASLYLLASQRRPPGSRPPG